VRRKLKQEVTAMEGSVKQLTGTPTTDLGDVVIGQGDFDRHLERNANHLLDNSEVQLRKEASRYGLKESGWIFQDYSMTTGPEQQKLQAEASRLAGLRSGCDVRRFTFLRLQKQADKTGREFEQAAKAIIDVSAEDAARREWIADEDAYHAACQKAQAEFPVLAAYTTGETAAEQLRAIGSESSTTLAERLYKTIDERIKNVASVREDMGGRLNLWQQPQLVASRKPTAPTNRGKSGSSTKPSPRSNKTRRNGRRLGPHSLSDSVCSPPFLPAAPPRWPPSPPLGPR
jgi:hypothetical protein